MDGGFYFWKNQGALCKILGLTVISFEHEVDRGLKRKKPGVSLEKNPGRTVTHDPRPMDRDLAVQI